MSLRYKKQVVFSLIYKCANILIAFGTTKLLTNLLGLESYGMWATIISIVSMAAFLNLGVSSVIQNEVIKEKLDSEKRNKNISLLIFINTVFSMIPLLIFGIFYLIGSRIVMPGFSVSQTLSILSLLTLCIYMSAILRIYIGESKSEFVELHASLIGGAFFITLLFLNLSENKLDINSSLIIYTIYTGVAAITFSIIPIKKHFYFFETISLSGLANILKPGLSFFLAQFFAFILYSSDRIIAFYMLGEESSAIFDYYMKFYMLILTMTGILQKPLWTFFGLENNKSIVTKTFKKINVIFVKLFPLMIMYSMVVPYLVSFFFLPGNKGENIMLSITLMFVTMIQAYGASYCYYLNSRNDLNGQVALNAISAILNIPLSYILSVTFNMGIVGISLATAISMLPFLIYSKWKVSKHLKAEI